MCGIDICLLRRRGCVGVVIEGCLEHVVCARFHRLNVVQVDYNAIVKKVTENVIHEMLKGSG